MENRPSFFRAEALKDYWQAQEKTISPELAAPCRFTFLWIGLGLLFMLAGLVAWTNHVPVYTTGMGLLLPDSSRPEQFSKQAIVLVFLPAEQLPKLQPGQTVELQSAIQPRPWSATLEKIEPEALKAEEIIQRYGLEKSLAKLVTHPSAVALANLKCEKDLDCRPIGASSGSPLLARVEIRSPRLLALLPLVDRIIGD